MISRIHFVCSIIDLVAGEVRTEGDDMADDRDGLFEEPQRACEHTNTHQDERQS